MKVTVISLDGKDCGSIDLSDGVFGLPKRLDILQRMVEWQRAKRQSGTHKTKGISEISGSTAKPWKQKGSGRARQGSKRSTQWVGGATVFGPVVRSHAHSLTKKFRQLGLKTALSAKLAEGRLVVIENAAFESGKTKDLAQRFLALGWKKPLIIDVNLDDHFTRAARNIKNVDVLPYVGINVYDILRHKELVLTKAAIASLEERFA